MALQLYLVPALHLGQPVLVGVQVPCLEAALIHVTLAADHGSVTCLSLGVLWLHSGDGFVATVRQGFVFAAADCSLIGLGLRGVPGLILVLLALVLQL